jgi:ABC-type molybdate transport system substrate-binding protein
MRLLDRVAAALLLVPLVAAILGCAREGESAPPTAPAAPAAKTELVVYAATSTRDVLKALEAAYERITPST